MAETLSAEQKNEIATTRDGRDITRGFIDSLPLIPSTDRLLALKGSGDLKIYQEVLRDDQVKTCFEQRIRAVISRPWEVQPGGNSHADKLAAQFIDEQLKKLCFDSITEKMLYGVFYGYAVAEPMYAIENNLIVLDSNRNGIRVRDRNRFGFAPDMSLRLKTMAKPLGEELPEKKFWHFATGSDHDDEPYGLGLAHWLYWPVFFKRNGLKFWLTFLEKFGMPTATGEYPSGASDTDQEKLLAALKAIQHDSAVTFPAGMKVALLEATRGGTADYTELYDRMDAAIARVTLGQTASTQGTPGRLGNDDLQGEVRSDIVKADADLVCMSLNATVVKWLTEWNFQGAAIPKVWRKCEEEEDQNTSSERDERISKMGFKPTLKYIQDKYGGEWVETTQNTGNPPFSAGGFPAKPLSTAQFAEAEQARFVDDELANRLSEEASPHWDAVLEQIRGIVNHAESLETLRDDLIASFGELPTSELVKVMAAGFAVAELVGIDAVNTEVKE